MDIVDTSRSIFMRLENDVQILNHRIYYHSTYASIYSFPQKNLCACIPTNSNLVFDTLRSNRKKYQQQYFMYDLVFLMIWETTETSQEKEGLQHS